MTSPINLNKARKAREKVRKKTKSTENVVKFGRTKAEKQLEATRKEALARLTDGHRLDKP
jgi:hypothetical protein